MVVVTLPGAQEMSLAAVDADGVQAEWVEAVVATLDQPTIVLFHGEKYAGNALGRARPMAASLAIATGARVLSVAGRSPDDLLTAYAWLVKEGLDPRRTAIIDESSDGDRTNDILLTANDRQLPLPATVSTAIRVVPGLPEATVRVAANERIEARRDKFSVVVATG